MSYKLQFGVSENDKFYNVVEIAGIPVIAVGSYNSATHMMADALNPTGPNVPSPAAIVNLFAEHLDDYEPLEDILSIWTGDFSSTVSVPRLQINIYDSADEGDEHTHIGKHFDQIVAFAKLFRGYPVKPVLFQCAAGISRSTTAACAYLMDAYSISLDRALELIRQVRVVEPNEWFLRQLREWEDELTKRDLAKRVRTLL